MKTFCTLILAVLSVVQLSAQSSLPNSVLGNWFLVDGSNTLELRVSDEYMMYDSEFWSFNEPIKKGKEWHVSLSQPGKTRQIVIREVGDFLILEDGRIIKRLSKDKLGEGRQRIPNQNVWKNDFFKSSQVTLSGVVKPKGEMPLTASVIYNHAFSSGQQKFTVNVDEYGRFKIFFPLDNPQDIMFRVGEVFTMFLAEPDSKMAVFVDEDKAVDGIDSWYAESPISFMGALAKENEELRVVKPKYMKVRNYFENDSLQKTLEPMEYLEYRLGLLKDHREFYQDYFSENSPSRIVKEYSERNINLYATNDLMRYRWLHDANKGALTPIDLPEAYEVKVKGMIDDEPLNMLAGEFGDLMREFSLAMMPKERDVMHDYRIEQVYGFLMSKIISESGRAEIEEWKVAEEKREKHFGYVKLSDPLKVRTEEFSKELLELNQKVTWDDLLMRIDMLDPMSKSSIIATYIDESYFSRGNEVPQVIWDKVKTLNLNSTARNVLERKYSDFVILKDKKFVNGVEIIDSEGDVLSQLKKTYPGKVVYIDVWATWCGPCITEFSYLPEIKASFKEDDNVVFVYLGAQSEKKSWETMVKKHELKGENFFLDDAQYAKFDQAVNITGFPTYMVITKEGKLIREGIKRPSAKKELVEQIKGFAKR
ncbi:TlpA disulfide reductase family protein [Roseivirga sp.]|uniref:TlpA family protein disulfide reductase n=1 Tax=Roseivirga sp. TaxID=1964215 RepID=UPI002B269CD3|nr:TlpA disulfide reductase family protein [Roseivirga sp.]